MHYPPDGGAGCAVAHPAEGVVAKAARMEEHVAGHAGQEARQEVGSGQCTTTSGSSVIRRGVVPGLCLLQRHPEVLQQSPPPIRDQHLIKQAPIQAYS
jgi:hypothetical protein